MVLGFDKQECPLKSDLNIPCYLEMVVGSLGVVLHRISLWKSNLMKSHLSINFFPFAQSFWNIVQSTVVSLSCSMLNFKIIWQMRHKVWKNEISQCFRLEGFRGVSHIAAAPAANACKQTGICQHTCIWHCMIGVHSKSYAHSSYFIVIWCLSVHFIHIHLGYVTGSKAVINAKNKIVWIPLIFLLTQIWAGPWFNVNYTSIRIPIVEIRWSYDHHISTVVFPILVKQHLYIESASRLSC